MLCGTASPENSAPAPQSLAGQAALALGMTAVALLRNVALKQIASETGGAAEVDEIVNADEGVEAGGDIGDQEGGDQEDVVHGDEDAVDEAGQVPEWQLWTAGALFVHLLFKYHPLMHLRYPSEKLETSFMGSHSYSLGGFHCFLLEGNKAACKKDV